MDSNPEPGALDTSAISSRQDFVVFLQQLRSNYLGNGKDWESQNLGDFLAALSAYANDTSGYNKNMPKADAHVADANVASWRVFAEMLCAATVYE